MFVSKHLTRWMRGCFLVSSSDAIPEDALRRANNVRLDRTLGALEVRPGWTAKTTTRFTAAVSFFTRLFGRSTTYGYGQSGTDLQRTSSTWEGKTSIATPGTVQLSSANSPDGEGTPWVYFVNGTTAVKDNGTLTQVMGIAPPTAAPLSAALATDLFIQISEMDVAANWTGTGTSAITDDATIFQETPSSVTYTIAASTFGSIAQFLGSPVDLDLLIGGDALVKNDDYIFLWIRVDRPERVTFLQLDIDIDSATTGLADAFRRNYFSVRLPALTRLSQGITEWSKLQVRKSEFTRYGTDVARTWAHARTFRIGILTNAQGAIAVNLDDFKLRGGIGLEGSISYTGTYQNSTTGGRGNPPLDADRVTLYTAPLEVDRQRVNVTISNVAQGGANHPGDTQIDKIQLWRKGGTFPEAVRVDTINDTAASPYLDDTSDETLVLTNLLLESDNNVLPVGTSRLLFGPDATGHFFCLVDGYRLYASKPYEADENRVENWPPDSFSLVGDGSTRALTGLATSTQVIVWTTAQTFQVIGVGAETFLPVPIEGSRGLTSRNGATSGNNTIYFVASDGIYAQRGQVQVKLTAAVDPFFQGRDVDGEAGITASDLSAAWLQFFPSPHGSMLVMLYGTNKALVLKPGPQGELTECFFDTFQLSGIQTLFFDDVNHELLAGADNGHIYEIEDASVYSDVGVAIPFHARTRSEVFDATSRAKYVAQAVLEGNTSEQALSLVHYYDRNATTEDLGVVSSNTDTALMQATSTFPTTLRHDVALDIAGSCTERVTITRAGFYIELQPEAVTFLDSGRIAFEFVTQAKRLLFDVNTFANITVHYYTDDILVHTGIFFATSGRANVNYPLPAGVRGRNHRVTLTAEDAFLAYTVVGWFKALGSIQGYQERPMLQAV